MIQCITSHWSKEYLTETIKLDYYGKHGALANNFATTLPAKEAQEVQSLLKDPYIFDMLTFTEQYDERDIEIGLIKHIEKFLVEMGAGFAFMGRQYHIEVSGDDYYIDMLMYNTFMHRYMVIELKATEFMPEYIGKLNFYCSAIDDTLCREGDNRTIGLLLCKTKDRIKAEYADSLSLTYNTITLLTQKKMQTFAHFFCVIYISWRNNSPIFVVTLHQLSKQQL